MAVANQILVGKSALEWFREMVVDVLGHRRMKVQEVTEFYLVNLLTRYVDREQLFVDDGEGNVAAEPLAFILLRALRSERRARAAGLRRLGDTALFVSGFFGDSLAGRPVDVDYYIAMGERAYGALAQSERGGGASAFEELSGRFPQFVDLLAEIAEMGQLRSNRGLVKLYERWLLTRSERVADMLAERGVALFGGPGAGRKGMLPQ